MKLKTIWKKLEKIGNKELLGYGKFKFKAWMGAGILVILLLFPNYMMSTLWASSYEGPQQEFAAVRFNNQAGYTGTQSIRINGLYSSGTRPQHYSTWNWGDPESVTIDVDGAKRGCPDLHFETSGYASIDASGQTSDNPIKKVEYTLWHNGKEYGVVNWLYFFRGYVTVSARGDEDYLGAHVDEIDWDVQDVNIYVKVGINKWIKTDPEDEMWTGIIKIDVRDVRGDTDIESHSEVYPASAPAQLSLFSDIGGNQYGDLNFDNFYGSWLNPDGIPDQGYYKLDIGEFSVGKKVLENKLVQPWAKWEIWCHVLVSRRFTLTQAHQGADQNPWINEEISWLDELRTLINDLTLGILDDLEKLFILLIVVAAILFFGLIVITSLINIGGRKIR